MHNTSLFSWAVCGVQRSTHKDAFHLRRSSAICRPIADSRRQHLTFKGMLHPKMYSLSTHHCADGGAGEVFESLKVNYPFNTFMSWFVWGDNTWGHFVYCVFLRMHCDDKCVNLLLRCTVAALCISDQDYRDYGRGEWHRHTQTHTHTLKGESSADGWCWWPDCSGPAAHWAVIATAGASGTDSSGAPIAQSWHLPLSTVCPGQPLTTPFVLSDGKTEVWNQLISSPTDLSFSFCLPRLAHQSLSTPLIHFVYLFSPLSSPSESHSSPPFSHICLFNIPSPKLPPSPPGSHSFIWIAPTSEGIIH